MRINRENTTSLMIDIQSKLFPHIYENIELEQKISKLIEGLKILELPITVTEQYTKGLGQTIPHVQKALARDYKPLEKMAFSCCDDINFMNEFEKQNKEFVIVAGIEAHVCVLQTVIDLIEKNYLPVVIEDCVSSRNPNDKAVAIERMRQEGARISTYESILFELLVYSGTDEFKAISKLVK